MMIAAQINVCVESVNAVVKENSASRMISVALVCAKMITNVHEGRICLAKMMWLHESHKQNRARE